MCVCVSPMRLYVYSKPNTRKQFCKRFPSGRPQIPPPPPSPARPRILACVWPSLPAAGFQSSRPWSRSELECPARKGAPWRPPERPRLRVARGVGAGGVPDRLMRTPNAPQPRLLIASRLAGSGPGPPPPGSINSPLLQMAAGSSLASRFTGDWGVAAGGGPPPVSLGQGGPKQPARAAAHPCCCASGTWGQKGLKLEPTAKRRETEAQKGQGTVQG